VGLGLLALLVPAGLFVTTLVLAADTTAVLVIVVIWEWMSLRPREAAQSTGKERSV
jgi:low temperature requirement protein LtrA